MNVLIVGSGGREHVLATVIKDSAYANEVFVSPGNPGMKDVATVVPAQGVDELLALIKKESVELVVIGPEQPLVDGLADQLHAEGISVFGPGKEGAMLEGSKAFAKEFMEEFSIPTAKVELAFSLDEAREILQKWEGLPVLKADGLAAGKGVFLPESLEETDAILLDLFVREQLGSAAKCLLFEERLYGPEISFFMLRNEKGYTYLGSARDHKRAYDGDLGPNTGGMGTVSPAEELSPDEKKDLEDILEKTHQGLLSSNIDFRGVLFIGVMRTEDGLKVLEYNVRFGDPETQSLLPRVQEDLLMLLKKTADGEELPEKVHYKYPAGLCVCIASEGYPISPATPQKVTLLPMEEDVLLFHAGTKEIDGNLMATGGRVFSLVAFGEDVVQARARVYKNIVHVQFPGMWYRKDI